MKTTEIMKIEYLEPVVRVKEVTRRRCVVASQGNSPLTSTVGTSDYENDDLASYSSEDIY